MAEHRELRPLRQPGQQGLRAVHLDELVEMHPRWYCQAGCHSVQKHVALLTPVSDGGCHVLRRQERHLVRVDEQEVILAQIGFTDRPPRGGSSLGRVIHPDDDQPGHRPFSAVVALTRARERWHRSPFADSPIVVAGRCRSSSSLVVDCQDFGPALLRRRHRRGGAGPYAPSLVAKMVTKVPVLACFGPFARPSTVSKTDLRSSKISIMT